MRQRQTLLGQARSSLILRPRQPVESWDMEQKSVPSRSPPCDTVAQTRFCVGGI